MMINIVKKSKRIALFSAVLFFFLLPVTPVFADYAGHVASFKSEENAVKYVEGMKARGLVAYYDKESISGKGEFFRVYVGRYKTLSLARKALTKLKQEGSIDSFKIREVAENQSEAETKKIKPMEQTGIWPEQPERKLEEPTTKVDTLQESEKIVTPSVTSGNYYAGIKGIVLKNGKVIKGQIISIDENDVLKIRTKSGKILSYSFVKDVQEYLIEGE